MVSSRSTAGEAPISPLPDLSRSPFCRLLPRCFAIGRKSSASARTPGCHRPQKIGGRSLRLRARASAPHGRVLAAVRSRLSDQCHWHRPLAQSLLNYADNRVAHSDALLLLSLLAGVQAAATLGTGFLVDRYEPRHLVPLAMLMLALASGLPAFGSGIAISVLYALSLGGAYGSQQAINAAGYAFSGSAFSSRTRVA